MNEYLGNKVVVLVNERTGETKTVSIQNVYLENGYSLGSLLKDYRTTQNEIKSIKSKLSDFANAYDKLVIANRKDKAAIRVEIEELKNNITDIKGGK